MISYAFLAIYLGLLWILPAFPWVVVLETQLSGYEAFPISGVFPWIVLLLVFISRYVKKRLFGKLFLPVVSLAAIAILWLNPVEKGQAAIQKFESITGIAGSQIDSVQTLMPTLYGSVVILLALIFPFLPDKKGSTGNKPVQVDPQEATTSREIWDSQS